MKPNEPIVQLDVKRRQSHVNNVLILRKHDVELPDAPVNEELDLIFDLGNDR